MNRNAAYCLVTATCGSRNEAKKLAELILKNRLAACIQLTKITSYYEWKNEVNKEDETLMLMKTRTNLYDQLEAFIMEHHSYEVPEIVCLPIQKGLPSYLGWIDDVTRG